MRYNRLIVIFLFFFSLCLEAESLNEGNGFKMELNVPSQKGNVAYLLKYWEGDTYIQDSMYISDQGKANFYSEQELPQGQYVIFIRPDIKMELLLGEEQNDIKVYVDKDDVRQSKITGSKDTELFWKYLLVLDDNMERDFALSDELEKEGLSDKERADIEKQRTVLASELQKYVQTQLELHKNSWFGVFLKGTVSPELPVSKPTTREDYEKNRTYMKYHYFDNIDLSDPRFWRTNYFASYLESYMSTMIEQTPDSLASAASRLVGKSTGNDFCFEKMLSYFTNESLHSNVMGIENVWMRLYEEYIREKNLDWIDSVQYKELDRLYVHAEYNRIGMKARDLSLRTLKAENINIYDIDADFLLLYFYNPSCGYCEQEIPKLYEQVYPKYKDHGLKVVTIDIGDDVMTWKAFVQRLKLSDWINCADPEHKSDYWIYYDTSGTPATFLLDKNKTIIARRFDKDGLEKILNYYIEK